MTVCLVLAALNCTPAAAAPPAPDEFVLQPFEVSDRGKPVVYEGEDAKRLARQVLPVATDSVMRVVTNPMIMLPMGAYYRGLWVEVIMEPRALGTDVCEEPHYLIDFVYKEPYVARDKVLLSFRGGHLEGHRFGEITPRTRYHLLPQPPASTELAEVACHALAADTSNWRQSDSKNNFLDQERGLAWLEKTLRSSGAALVSCIDTDGKPCNNDRTRLLAVLQEKPPIYSQKLFVPGEGWIRVFRYYQSRETVGDDHVSNDYTVTMREPLSPRPATIRFEFNRNTIPLV